MFKNKRILFLCKETFSFPLYFLAKKLLQNNTVGAFFVNPVESYLYKSQFNENTYFRWKELINRDNFYSMKDLVGEFNKKCDYDKVDYEYLTLIEDGTYHKNLNLQMVSSQLMTYNYHNRFYFNKGSNLQYLLYIELCYKKTENVLNDFKPDMILDLNDGELVRTIINEISVARKIPYININYPRYEDYKTPSFCMGIEVDDYFKKEFNKYINKKTATLSDELKYIESYRERSDIMPAEFKGTTTSQYHPDSIIKVVKTLIGKVLYFINLSLLSRNYKIIKNNIIFTSPFRHLLFYFYIAIKRQLLYRKNRYFSEPLDGEKYVYMPLHLIPESTTFSKAPFYINELNLIEQISKSLPIDWKLYVKEHQSMVGERKTRFYRDVNSFHNVRLVRFNYYKDPKPWIEKSIGVITITGTGAYEAALMGKKSIIFGDVPFMLIDGVTRVRSFEDLPVLLKSLGPIDNTVSCAAYIAAVKSIGTKLNIKHLMSEGEKILQGNVDYTSNYDKKIDKLMLFFSQAYKLYYSVEKQN